MESSESEPSAENHDISNGHLPEEVSGAESSPSLIPPYWSHRRYESYSSVKNTRPPPITLEDHTEEPSEQSGALWAKSITIDDHVLLSGTLPNVGSFVVWNCKIETLDVSLVSLLCERSCCCLTSYDLQSFCHANGSEGRVHHDQEKVNANLTSIQFLLD